MSPQMQSLEAMLSCVTARGNQHDHVCIEEPNSGASLRRVIVSGLPDDSFAFDPDRGRGLQALMSPLFAKPTGSAHNKACDGVIVRNSDGQLGVLYVDLKSASTSGSAAQFKSTRCFVSYLLDVAEKCNGLQIQAAVERYVVFFAPNSGKRTLAKQPTRLKGIPGGGSPDNPKRIPVSNGEKIPLGLLLA